MPKNRVFGRSEGGEAEAFIISAKDRKSPAFSLLLYREDIWIFLEKHDTVH